MSSHTKVLMKAGWYTNDIGERVVQSMQHGIQKGVQTNLKERETQKYGREKSSSAVQTLQR